jgi:hypothetical protein
MTNFTAVNSRCVAVQAAVAPTRRVPRRSPPPEPQIPSSISRRAMMLGGVGAGLLPSQAHARPRQHAILPKAPPSACVPWLTPEDAVHMVALTVPLFPRGARQSPSR